MKKIPLCCNFLEDQHSGVLGHLLPSHSISYLGNVSANLLPTLSLLPKPYSSLCISGFKIFHSTELLAPLPSGTDSTDSNDSLLFTDALVVW